MLEAQICETRGLCRDAKNLLERWAMEQLDGRLRAAGFRTPGRQASAIDEGMRSWLHTEQFWDQGENRRFREMALHVFGEHKPLESWIWYMPWEPRFRSCLRRGWGWVKDFSDPLPEVWAAFEKAFGEWHASNPLTGLATIVEESPMSRRKAWGRLISVRTACEITGAALSTMQEWCRKGRFKGAILFGDWSIPLGEVVQFERPKRGRPKKERP